MTEVIFTNAKIVLRDAIIKGSIRVVDGKISDIATHVNCKKGTSIDCEGNYILPGLVELHTDNLERHIEPRPGVQWSHTAALIAHDAELASVGITTVFDGMRVGSINNYDKADAPYARILTNEMLNLRKKGLLKISHFLHLRAEICSATLGEELQTFRARDRIGIVSLMDHTPGQRQFRDLSQFKRYMSGKHNMNDQEFINYCVELSKLRERYGAKHECDAVAAAKRYGAILASHDDTTATQVTVSAGHGVKLAEFPTTIEAAMACRDNKIAVMMGAPNLIRNKSHSGNVSAQELANRGLIDILSSDYIPVALLESAFTLGELWGNVSRGIAAVTYMPAQITGLFDRGEIAIGRRADLVYMCRFDGATFVRGVWSRGQRIC